MATPASAASLAADQSMSSSNVVPSRERPLDMEASNADEAKGATTEEEAQGQFLGSNTAAQEDLSSSSPRGDDGDTAEDIFEASFDVPQDQLQRMKEETQADLTGFQRPERELLFERIIEIEQNSRREGGTEREVGISVESALVIGENNQSLVGLLKHENTVCTEAEWRANAVFLLARTLSASGAPLTLDRMVEEIANIGTYELANTILKLPNIDAEVGCPISYLTNYRKTIVALSKVAKDTFETGVHKAPSFEDRQYVSFTNKPESIIWDVNSDVANERGVASDSFDPTAEETASILQSGTYSGERVAEAPSPVPSSCDEALPDPGIYKLIENILLPNTSKAGGVRTPRPQSAASRDSDGDIEMIAEDPIRSLYEDEADFDDSIVDLEQDDYVEQDLPPQTVEERSPIVDIVSNDTNDDLPDEPMTDAVQDQGERSPNTLACERDMFGGDTSADESPPPTPGLPGYAGEVITPDNITMDHVRPVMYREAHEEKWSYRESPWFPLSFPPPPREGHKRGGDARALNVAAQNIWGLSDPRRIDRFQIAMPWSTPLNRSDFSIGCDKHMQKFKDAILYAVEQHRIAARTEQWWASHLRRRTRNDARSVSEYFTDFDEYRAWFPCLEVEPKIVQWTDLSGLTACRLARAGCAELLSSHMLRFLPMSLKETFRCQMKILRHSHQIARSSNAEYTGAIPYADLILAMRREEPNRILGQEYIS